MVNRNAELQEMWRRLEEARRSAELIGDEVQATRIADTQEHIRNMVGKQLTK